MNKTNNDILWDVVVEILKKESTIETFKRVDEFLFNYRLHKGKEIKENFSFDNMLGVLCWLNMFYPEDKRLVPVFGRHTLHPIRLLRILWMRHNLLYPLRLITICDMLIRHGLTRRKDHHGQYHTSGLLLDFYATTAYNAKIQRFILDKLMLTMFNGWRAVFFRYHGNPNHNNYKVYTTFLEINNEIENNNNTEEK